MARKSQKREQLRKLKQKRAQRKKKVTFHTRSGPVSFFAKR